MNQLDPMSDDALAALVHRANTALPDAPPALLHAAVGLWQAPAGLRTVLRRVAALLSFDSWALAPQAVGMRGAGDDNRHLLFSAEGRDVDLRIVRSSAGGWQLAGQVLGPDERGRIALVPAGGEGAGHSAALDDMGEFCLDGVPEGTWQLSLETADTVVELPAIQVGAARPA